MNNDKFLGTLKYVEEFEEYSEDTDEQSGNYIALKATATAGATVTVEIIGGDADPVTLDEDMNIVIRVADVSQAVKFTATKGGVSKSLVLRFASLTLEAAT